MTRVAVLHTVPALVPVFHELLTREPGLDVMHVADPALLAAAVATGVTDDLRATIERHLAGLRDAGAEAVLVTCSSIGEAAETAAAAVGVPLVRVDAAMADEAVRRAARGGGRVTVLATLEATVGPTRRLVERAARPASAAGAGGGEAGGGAASSGEAPGGGTPRSEASGRAAVGVDARVVAGAAIARAAGDTATHDALIAAAVAAERAADVIVLAQASMVAGAGADPRVLTSPESGAAAFVAAVSAPS